MPLRQSFDAQLSALQQELCRMGSYVEDMLADAMKALATQDIELANRAIAMDDVADGMDISIGTPWVLSLYDRYWFLRSDYKAYAEPGKIKVPFLSQPPRHYLGVAWYQRDVNVPQYQPARRFVLTLERPHWETTVWLDGQKIGSNRSLVAPHVYDLGTISDRHRLTIRVDNRMLMPYRPDAHSVSDSLGAS